VTIKSPLGALGAVIMLVEAISASALWAVQSQPTLQLILTIVIAVTIGAVRSYSDSPYCLFGKEKPRTSF